MSFEAITVDHIDRLLEQAGDVLISAYSNTVRCADGSISTMMSISLSGRLSPRATEPNTAARRTLEVGFGS